MSDPGEDIIPPLPGVQGRSNLPWARNPESLARIERTIDLLAQGKSPYAISLATGIPYSTVLLDVKRIDNTYKMRIGQRVEEVRARAVRRLDGVVQRALRQHDQDQVWNMAVLFDTPVIVECPGGVVHRIAEAPNPADPDLPRRRRQPPPGTDGQPNPDDPTWEAAGKLIGGRDAADDLLEQVFGGPEYGRPGERCPGPHLVQYRVWRDAHGAAEYRSQGSALLETARKALMDEAKLQGLIIERVAPTDGNGNDLAGTLAKLLAKHGNTQPQQVYDADTGTMVDDGNALPEPA